jgi:hypothetical protein
MNLRVVEDERQILALFSGVSPLCHAVRLYAELEDFNQRTWQAGTDLVEKWAAEGSENGAPLKTGARFAFALFLMLTRHSVEQKLPMRLDW